MDRLAHKFEAMRNHVPEPAEEARAGSRIGMIAIGSSDYAARESCDQLQAEHSVAVSYLRLRAFPFTAHLTDFIRRHDRVYVIDQNRDAQLLLLMRLELEPDLIARLRSVRYYGGMPIDARTITDEIVKQEGK
jgi:2-oxoglutarate ferredoxin oxidoreductase subunit alpha